MKEIFGVAIVIVLAFLVTTGVINIGHKSSKTPAPPVVETKAPGQRSIEILDEINRRLTAAEHPAPADCTGICDYPAWMEHVDAVNRKPAVAKPSIAKLPAARPIARPPLPRPRPTDAPPRVKPRHRAATKSAPVAPPPEPCPLERLWFGFCQPPPA